MKSNSHIKKFPFKELRKCAKNEVWEKMDQNWSLGPATTSSIQKPEQPTNNTVGQGGVGIIFTCLIDYKIRIIILVL